MFKEFRDFAMRGNVVDLAVGVIIGAAFGKIVTSLVDDVFMPPIGMLLQGIDFSQLALCLSHKPDGTCASAVKYGVFINATVQFVIVAFVVFLVVKGMNSAHKKQVEAPAEAPPPPPDVALLTEIRDLLRQKA